MTMLEKIAIAIDAGFDKGGLEGAARAAVDAMRTPNEAIMNAGYNTIPDTYSLPVGALELMTRAMIDAILSEQPDAQPLDETNKP